MNRFAKPIGKIPKQVINQRRLYGLNDLDHAITELNEAIPLNPQDASSYVDRGVCYERSGNVDQAIADYRMALQCDPNLIVAQNNLQSLLSHHGKTAGTPITIRKQNRAT